ncbi:hypothetical protein FVE85_0165 [Porphyridium purpureum]|uniref:Uncharacterized protein n=1 Tax=Porphyridium purpureum TaxID=35688 RepID=A0A5J4YYP6_PORPP|nr:hypothetical protein FVE85_0165 [Porphyridium purpureum]|eukprot:POR3613..scf208_2
MFLADSPDGVPALYWNLFLCAVTLLVFVFLSLLCVLLKELCGIGLGFGYEALHVASSMSVRSRLALDGVHDDSKSVLFSVGGVATKEMLIDAHEKAGHRRGDIRVPVNGRITTVCETRPIKRLTELLIETGGDDIKLDADAFSALFCIAASIGERDYSDDLKALIGGGLLANAGDEDRLTALPDACHTAQSQNVSVLLHIGSRALHCRAFQAQ